MKWSLVYEKAIRQDGSLLFPERLTQEFLDNARRVMGSYLFANQYQNEVIPEGEQTFKKEWVRHVEFDPNSGTIHNNIAFIDPAIGLSKSHDYTALVVVSVTADKRWYVRHASRHRINPSEIIEMMFRVHEQWKCVRIGIEDVAFQKSLLHFGAEEARRRGVALPIHGQSRGPDKTKQMRILGLVPRFEWGSLFLANGLYDLETELAQFPRGSHDDLLDALASIEDVVVYPQSVRRKDEAPPPSDAGAYEQWYRRQIHRRTRTSEGAIP